MNPILLVIPYHKGDFELAQKLINWIAELGSCRPHSLLLCADSQVPQDDMRKLMESARPHFNRVATMIVTVPTASEGKRVWPPNSMFLAAARQVKENYKLNFLWLEPDGIPIYSGWLDDIAEEYDECPRRFMGSIIKQQGQPGMPSEYLNGVAVYPNNAIDLFENIESIKDGSQAWDIGSASVIVHRAMDTPLLKHFFGTKELPPIFVAAKTPDSPKNHVTLDFVPLQAAIFHRSKDGKLIDLLQSKRNESKIAFDSNTNVHTAKKAIEELKDVVVSELTEIPASSAPVVDMLPVAPNEVTREQSETIKRGPGRPRKVEASV